jgi:hypothetical protein
MVIHLRFAKLILFFRESRRIAGLSRQAALFKTGLSIEEIALSETNPERLPINRLAHLAQIYRADLFKFEYLMNEIMCSIRAEKMPKGEAEKFIETSQKCLSLVSELYGIEN